MTIENINGVVPDDIAFRISSEYHYGFDLLEDQHKLVAVSGREVIIYNSGEIAVADKDVQIKETDEDTLTIPVGAFSWIEEDYLAPTTTIDVNDRRYIIADLSSADRKLANLKGKLNGKSSRLVSIAEHNIKQGIVNMGRIRGVQALEIEGKTVLSVHNEDPDPNNRLSVFFGLPEQGSDIAYLFAGSRYNDSRKVINRIGASSYRSNSKNPN